MEVRIRPLRGAQVPPGGDLFDRQRRLSLRGSQSPTLILCALILILAKDI